MIESMTPEPTVGAPRQAANVPNDSSKVRSSDRSKDSGPSACSRHASLKPLRVAKVASGRLPESSESATQGLGYALGSGLVRRDHNRRQTCPRWLLQAHPYLSEGRPELADEVDVVVPLIDEVHIVPRRRVPFGEA